MGRDPDWSWCLLRKVFLVTVHVTGADRYTRITQLHEMLNLDTLETRIKQLALKTRDTYTNHDETLIQNIGQSEHSNRLHYRRPTQLTD